MARTRNTWRIDPDPERFGDVAAAEVEVLDGTLIFRDWELTAHGTTGRLLLKLVVARGSWLSVELLPQPAGRAKEE